MIIALGIMLWNEERSIGMTVDSLFEQTLLTNHDDQIESIHVTVLANGCTDNSVPEAEEAIKRNLKECPLDNIDAQVVELKEKGRSNAWNSFVHELAPEDVSYIFLMDADIIIDNPETCRNMVAGLESHPECYVASSLGIKDIEKHDQHSVMSRLTLKMTQLEHNARLAYLCGGLYVGRADFFRRFLFPKGFVCGDDGFIKTLATTNLMTTEHEFHRVYQTPEATFEFEAYTAISVLFKQHVRRAVGTTVREMINDYVRLERLKTNKDAGEIIISATEADPDWLLKYQEEIIIQRGFWVIPPSKITYRFTQLRGKSLAYRLAKIPLVLLGTVWLTAVILVANRKLKKKDYLGVWLNNPNERMLSNKSNYIPKESKSTID